MVSAECPLAQLAVGLRSIQSSVSVSAKLNSNEFDILICVHIGIVVILRCRTMSKHCVVWVLVVVTGP